MAQVDIIKLLENNRGRKFTTKEIYLCLKIGIVTCRRNLSKLVKSKEIKRKEIKIGNMIGYKYWID